MPEEDSTELVPIEPEPQELSVVNQEAQLVEAAARAATDPSVDVDKMERLLAMTKEVRADQARRAFNEALHRFQMECPQLEKTTAIVVKGQQRSKFVSYEKMLGVIRPYMAKNGFSERFDTNMDDRGVISSVTCYLNHIGGHTEQSNFPVRPDTTGAKSEAQATASAISYGMRYGLRQCLGLVFAGDDYDGNKVEQLETDRALNEIVNPAEPEKNTPTSGDPGGRAQWIAEVEAQIKADPTKPSGAELTEAMLRLAPAEAMPGDSPNWHNLSDQYLVALTKPAGWKKAMAKVGEIRAEAE